MTRIPPPISDGVIDSCRISGAISIVDSGSGNGYTPTCPEVLRDNASIQNQ